MDPNTRALIMGAGGGAAAEKIYVEDVFSTWLYTGNGSTQTITNGIDLAGKGGLVWLKSRSSAGTWHGFYDTVRGPGAALYSNRTDAQVSNPSFGVTAFGATGFTLGLDSAGENPSGQTCVSWTFREQAKFFDVVTFTSTGSNANRRISHSLGAAPGFLVVKRLDSTSDWFTYHRSTGRGSFGYLNLTNAFVTQANVWGTADPTSTDFGINENALTVNGGTYVAYLFAHDAGGFGDSGNDSIISCGLVTANGSGQLPEVNLGWEPQWILRKRIDYAVNWEIVDNMRGMPPGNGMNSAARLFPNTSGAEDSTFPAFGPTATGFTDGSGFNPNEKIIYIAIRRGPMKTPTDATKVFATSLGATATPAFSSTFPVDLALTSYRSGGGGNHYMVDRIRGQRSLETPSTAAEGAVSSLWKLDQQTGFAESGGGWGSTHVCSMFRRAPGFFDVVAYTGGASAISVSHNLGVQPELVICKRRNAAQFWIAGVTSLINGAYAVNFSSANAFFDAGAGFLGNDSTKLAPTSSTLSFGSAASCNGSGGIFIAYLFASCPGVSKVGSYTGTGTTLNVDCGFTNGARFVLIKRTDSTGDWYVWDTARGIVSGNDPYLLLNSTAAEVTNTDFIDPLSSGFQISSTAPAAVNANGGSFIYLAIA